MTLRLLTCCMFLLLACAQQAHALEEYCVSSPADFQNALDQAEIDTDDSLIKVRAGTYALSTKLVYAPFLENAIPAGRLTIRGGYDAGCNNYSLTPGATTITGTSQIGLEIITITGHASVNGITLQGSPLTMYSPVLRDCPSQRRTFALRRVRIDQAMFYAAAWCHNIVVENSIFSNGVTNPAVGAPANTGFSVYLVHNEDDYDSAPTLTMVNSSVINGLTELTSNIGGPPGNAFLYNNIFSHPGNDILTQSHVFARNNRFDGITFAGGAMLLPGSGQNTSVPPQLDANHIPAVSSPMVNAGTSVVPDGLPERDHAGNARVIGPAVDIGAMESPFDGTSTYVVTNANASGPGSLAQAMADANTAPGFNRIRFNIPGNCPHSIPLTGALQVHETVNVDGWSQPGSVKNTSESGFNATPCIILSGAGGIGIETMGPLGSESITVRGLAFQGFELALALAFGQGHAIYGNQFGGRVGSTGPVLSGNTQAIGLIGGGKTVVGGYDPAFRNLIGGSSDVGVLITTFLGAGGDDNSVLGNLIGIGKDGTSALANGTGIRINGGSNLIRENRIGANSVDGILLSGENAEGNKIIDNIIGSSVGAIALPLGNGRMGVMIENDAHDNRIQGNTIGRNGDDGVRIMPTARGHNTITANRIARNGALGIDLGSNGISSNDNDPTFCEATLGCSANRGQNFPALTGAQLRHSGVIPVDRPIRVRGTLRSTPGTYRIEVFGGDACEANGHGEGQRPLGSTAMTIEMATYCPPGSSICIACSNGNCTAPFTTWLPELDLAVGDSITVTATSPGGDTSEFSACMTLSEEPGAPGGNAIFSDGFED